jgi:thiosulfate/3-mercaptopyruvate sulfurtransferase
MPNNAMTTATGRAINPDRLWSVETLRARLGTPGLSIVDTRPAELFSAGRVPGARHFDPYFVNCDDTDPAPLASFTRMWANMLGWRGVKPTDTIVFCGAFTDMCAARGFWFAEYLGCPNVHVLDGGMRAWTEAGLPVERQSTPPSPNKFPFEAVPTRVATYASILAAIDDPGCLILDNRSRAEFTGEDCRARYGGAVPSARHCDWEDLYDHGTGRMKPLEDLRRIFEAHGVTPDRRTPTWRCACSGIPRCATTSAPGRNGAIATACRSCGPSSAPTIRFAVARTMLHSALRNP